VTSPFVGHFNLHIAIEWHQWNHLNGAIDHQWLSPLDPMVIANGDGVLHWRHYVYHHWGQRIAIGTIFCRHWHQWHQYREPQIVMTLLPND
jgi:hypothetical protein